MEDTSLNMPEFGVGVLFSWIADGSRPLADALRSPG